MALTGIVLIGFVFVHMAGNLQMLAGQEQINAYAHALQSLPWFVLWGSRLFLLLCVVLHAWTAFALISENRKARPQANRIEDTKRAGWSSLNMGLTGSILLAFIVFHLLHFTIRVVYPEYDNLKTTVGSPDGSDIQDVYSNGRGWISRRGRFHLLRRIHVFALLSPLPWRFQRFSIPRASFGVMEKQTRNVLASVCMDYLCGFFHRACRRACPKI